MQELTNKLQVASSQGLCVFCALRLTGRKPGITNRIDEQRRHFDTSVSLYRPPGELYAVADSEKSDYVSRSVQPPTAASKSSQPFWPASAPKPGFSKETQPTDRPPESTASTNALKQKISSPTAWACENCGNHNLARRTACAICRRAKPGFRGKQPFNRDAQPQNVWGHVWYGHLSMNSNSRTLFRDGQGSENHDGDTDVDTKNRSGLQALLEYAHTPKSSSRGPRVKQDKHSGRQSTRWSGDGGNAVSSAQGRETPQSASYMTPLLDSTRVSGNPQFRPGTTEPLVNAAQAEPQTEAPRSRGRFSETLGDGDEDTSEVKTPVRRHRGKDGRRARRQADEDMYDDPDEELFFERQERKKKANTATSEKVESRTAVQLPEFISVENLATALRLRLDDFISRMEDLGFERPRHDHILDAETSGLIAGELNYEPTFGQEGEGQDLVAQPAPEKVSELPLRPPVVTIMGHVDHGKTTILDWLRKSSITASEHGGITQHIGAFSVRLSGGKQITFLDTPGHAAFLDMRRRGANVTDIVILVVASDDSVKPQTIEAIKHATDAKVPIIVAMNKVDKQDANVETVQQDLARHGVTVEAYGGDVQAIGVSGKFGQGMAELEEATVTLSEVLDYRAPVDGPVEGWIIESNVTLAGRVATVLVRRGTLRPGDIIIAGNTWARVRTLRTDVGNLVDEALPGTPVQVDGWRGDDPMAGQEVLQAEDEDHAKAVLDIRLDRENSTRMADDAAAINVMRAEEAEARAQQLAWEAQQGWASLGYRRRPKDNTGWVEGKTSTGPRQVHFVVKADVSGSVEAVVNSITAIGNNEVAANVIRTGVGEINESDVQHLASSGETGYLISFNRPVDGTVARLAQATGLGILEHKIIYKLTDVVREKLSAQLSPLVTQRVVGEAEINKVFEINIKRQKWRVAGCRIHNGLITRAKKIRVLRGSETIYDGMSPCISLHPCYLQTHLFLFLLLLCQAFFYSVVSFACSNLLPPIHLMKTTLMLILDVRNPQFAEERQEGC